jgi:hypothetical protein
MAGTVTLSIGHRLGYETYDLDWVSDGAGAVSGTLVSVGPGWLKFIYVIPNLLATQPDNLFDVEIRTASNLNLLDEEGTNLGLNRPNSESSYYGFGHPGFPLDVQSTVQIIIAGAGASKTGRVSLYIGAK